MTTIPAGSTSAHDSHHEARTFIQDMENAAMTPPEHPSPIRERRWIFSCRGNERFAEGRMTHPRGDASRRRELVAGQNPFAVILVARTPGSPPELIFDQGIGDLFVVRSAGNVLDSVILGGLEYAASVLATPLIVVLGHQNCGAVNATLSGNPWTDP